MVIDTSALLAVLLDEPEARSIARSIATGPRRLLSSCTALETAVVVEAKMGEGAGREFDRLVHKAELDIVPMDAGQVELARDAWRRYGKGRHRAGLNIGGCCTFALARLTGEPRLFTGADMAETDVHRVDP